MACPYQRVCVFMLVYAAVCDFSHFCNSVHQHQSAALIRIHCIIDNDIFLQKCAQMSGHGGAIVSINGIFACVSFNVPSPPPPLAALVVL